MHPLFNDIYRNRKVLITGHTGFKGSWLALWLHEMGAELAGYALPPPTEPSHWSKLDIPLKEYLGDITDRNFLEQAVREFQPEIVFHLAAQPLVRESYRVPAHTYSTNVVGSVNVYEACRQAGCVHAIVSITTDKVYLNREWVYGYRENDPFGGHDPYSASKACAEIATASYRDSYWPVAEYGKKHRTLLATTRAGNVVGGGDWADDRLIPDLMRAAAQQQEAIIRNPDSTRPWQHVLEPLAGYLMLGWRLLEGRVEFADGWNFGPREDGVIPVGTLVRKMQAEWSAIQVKEQRDPNAPHEARLLKLDCSKARDQLGWQPVWDSSRTVAITTRWYRHYHQKHQLHSHADITEYVRDAALQNIPGFCQ